MLVSSDVIVMGSRLKSVILILFFMFYQY